VRHRGDEGAKVGDGKGGVRRGNLTVFADRHEELAAGREFLHAMVLPVGDVDVAIPVKVNAPGLVELALTAAAPAPLLKGLALGREHLQPVVAGIDDDQISVSVTDNAGRSPEFTGATPD